jgi:hypothetical protein
MTPQELVNLLVNDFIMLIVFYAMLVYAFNDNQPKN